MKKGNFMKLLVNLKDRPVLTITEVVGMLGISSSTIKRKIASGEIKAIPHQNIKYYQLLCI